MLEVAPLPSFDADAEKRDSTPMMRRAAASVTACEEELPSWLSSASRIAKNSQVGIITGLMVQWHGSDKPRNGIETCCSLSLGTEDGMVG